MSNTQSQKKASINIPIIIAGAIVIVIAVAGVFIFKNGSHSKFESLPNQQYSSDPIAFAGNTYQLMGRVDTQLGYQENTGRLILVKHIESNAPVPIYASESLNEFSPTPGQVFRLVVKVDSEGILNLLSYTKV